MVATFSVFAQNEEQPNTVIVAQDGSGDFKSIQEALDTRKAFRNYEQQIFIKNGVYEEKVLIDSYLTNIRLTGESVEGVIVTHSDHAGMAGIGTFNSYTMKVVGDQITLENLTIVNASGPVGQAVALHVEGDCFLSKNCQLKGDQDTLYAAGPKSNQYYWSCYIEGTTDFIFGAAMAIFENCVIHSKKNSYITAASTPEGREFGYVFRNCQLTAAEGVDEVYLGRPWRDYAQVAFIDCEMGAHIPPEGWHNWNQPNREQTSYYAEFGSTGAGANPESRVNWSHQLKEEDLDKYTLEKLIGNCQQLESVEPAK